MRAACHAEAFVPLFGLAPGGVYHATSVTRSAVRSYRTLSPLPELHSGGLLSVALAVDLRPPGVTWHLTLWSPDFPHFCKRDCLAISTRHFTGAALFLMKFQRHFIGFVFLDTENGGSNGRSLF